LKSAIEIKINFTAGRSGYHRQSHIIGLQRPQSVASGAAALAVPGHSPLVNKGGLPMTKKPSPSRMYAWLYRVDRIAADMNVFLVVFAIGLAAMDLTFLATQRVIDRLPEVTRVVYVAEPASSAIPAGEQDFP
jgi:hypothetical protein